MMHQLFVYFPVFDYLMTCLKWTYLHLMQVPQKISSLNEAERQSLMVHLKIWREREKKKKQKEEGDKKDGESLDDMEEQGASDTEIVEDTTHPDKVDTITGGVAMDVAPSNKKLSNEEAIIAGVKSLRLSPDDTRSGKSPADVTASGGHDGKGVAMSDGQDEPTNPCDKDCGQEGCGDSGCDDGCGNKGDVHKKAVETILSNIIPKTMPKTQWIDKGMLTRLQKVNMCYCMVR